MTSDSDNKNQPRTRVARSAAWRAEFVRLHNRRCHYCNRPGTADVGPDDRPWHIDHMNPISRGGEDGDSNLTLACKRCNLTKSAQRYSQFREFARLAFWEPDDWRLSEGDLDSLMELYAEPLDEDAGDSSWYLECETESICVFDVDGDFVPLLQFGGNYKRRGYMKDGYFKVQESHMEVLVLITEMRKALPALVAEIRMHRAAEREAAGEQEAQHAA